jgi:hypothetical protein
MGVKSPSIKTNSPSPYQGEGDKGDRVKIINNSLTKITP